MAPPPPSALALEENTLKNGALGRRILPDPPADPASFRRKLFAFAGPGYLVAVGYMDPGNWATDLAGGSRFGYQLLSVILLSNLMAMVLQSLSARLGIATGMDLAQACRERYEPATRIALWLLCEAAIIACELAEVIGTGVALNLLFGLPLAWGVCLSALNVVFISVLEHSGARRLEAFIVALILVVALCLGIETWMARPDLQALARGLVPNPATLTDPAMLYVAIGILGATVMPHNLYLHSAIVRGRASVSGEAEKREAIRFSSIDSAVALSLAMFVNAAILIVAAATFHANGRTDVVEIGQAYLLLSPMLGAGFASILFGVALLASGQNSIITGALAGQVVMEGFTNLRIPVWTRRLAARAIAIIPAAIVAATWGEFGASRLLVMSQVILSLQLPFAIIPLVRIASDRARMGALASPRWLTITAWVIAGLIVALNATLVLGLMRGDG
jgi:manganese transport protein